MPNRKKVSHKVKKANYFWRFFWGFIAAGVVFIIGFFLQYNSATVYTGTLPCADCSGIQTTLTIYGNHSYQLESLYIDRGAPIVEKGIWQQIEKNNMQVYQLRSNEEISYYQIVDEGTLKILSSDGSSIDAPFNLDLKRK